MQLDILHIKINLLTAYANYDESEQLNECSQVLHIALRREKSHGIGMNPTISTVTKDVLALESAQEIRIRGPVPI